MPRRPRDLAATRAALLQAARELFTLRGYDSVGVREIAAHAGTDKALIARYFGSKEGLFVEAILRTLDIRPLLEGDRASFGQRAAQGIVAERCSETFSPNLAMLRSLGSPVAALQIRHWIEDSLVEPLTAWIGGTDARSRATMIVSQMFGFWIGTSVVPIGSFRSASALEIISQTAPILQRLVEEGD